MITNFKIFEKTKYTEDYWPVKKIVGKIIKKTYNKISHEYRCIVDYPIYDFTVTKYNLYEGQLREATQEEIDNYIIKESEVKYNL